MASRNYPFKSCGPNECGNSSDNRVEAGAPVPLSRITTISLSIDVNSLRTCLHAPHGVAPAALGADTATARISRYLSATALNTATRSPHTVRPKLAFSILLPEKILPL